MKRRIAVFSVVPSPYQRDLFAALHARAEIDLQVFYLEAASPDSPWPEKPLAAYEQILPGFWFTLGSARIHTNWSLPNLATFDLVIVNTLMSITAQWLMRWRLRHTPWIFLGEKLGARRAGWHEWLSSPLHRAAGIAAIGRWAQRDYAERFAKPRSFCLPYACDLDPFFATERHALADEVTFLLCGQMIARKGVDILLRAFARLDRGRLVLVGREAELPAMLAQLPEAARARIEYAGFQAPDDLPRFFARADVFILPSRYDGWGVVINQAIAAGLPVICSDQVGAGHDLVEANHNGLIFPSGDEDALLVAMRHFVENPSTIVPWGESSRAKAQTITPELVASRWSEAIESILTGNR